MKSEDIAAITMGVTKKWAKQRKAEERDSRAKYRREQLYSDRVCATDVAHKIIPAGYLKASGNGAMPVSQRQIFYAVREEFRKQTGQSIDFKYFSQNILRKYLKRADTQSWRVTRDARGTFIEPHTNKAVPIGTLQIDAYLRQCQAKYDEKKDAKYQFATQFPATGPSARYQAVLYIEKEGFNELFREVKLAERFDIAIMSCKGQSVIAARKLVDEFCHAEGIPLLVLHDFDKYGFSICQTLSQVSWAAEEADNVAYQFRNEIEAIDLGLRLEDVEKWNLEFERCEFTGDFDGGCDITEDEQEYLRSGRRVELNAFTSPDFVKFVEEKLRDAGITEKFIPDDDILDAAYRRAVELVDITAAVEAVCADASRKANKARIPNSLRTQIRNVLIAEPTKPWDSALFEIVGKKTAPKKPRASKKGKRHATR